MQGEVKAFALHLVGDAQTDYRIDDLEQDQAKRPRRRQITITMP